MCPSCPYVLKKAIIAMKFCDIEGSLCASRPLTVQILRVRGGSLVGCRFESNCPLLGPGTIGGVPSVGGGVFLRDPSLYLG